jgi:hypothetical protein
MEPFMKHSSVGAKAVYAMFFLSGISGLIYETIWLRMLIRVLGNTVYATSIILAAFMAGLALGSLALGKFAGRAKNHLKLYAMLEIGAALCFFSMRRCLSSSLKMPSHYVQQSLYGISALAAFKRYIGKIFAGCAVVDGLERKAFSEIITGLCNQGPVISPMTNDL